ncbi:N-acetylmuramoyl-L-alanine amidase-like domain-containing protein [Hyella patelloides]|nr:N-acetylmuramoyl-L-alanine amidase-like domain-containing protein [Hyella patelloides]
MPVNSYPNELENRRIINREIASLIEKEKQQQEREISQEIIYLPDTKDEKIFQSLINKAIETNLKQTGFGEIIQTVATDFLGSQYQAGLLDRSPQETLVISLQKFDCVLFVESVIAIARSIASQDYNYDNFTKNVVEQRYSQGKMIDYCSRLHYFSHWIADNQKRNLVTNITADLGGTTIQKKLDFMTTNRNSYAQLKNEHNYQCITNVEKSLEQLNFNYIPTQNVRSIYERLQPGDIIGIATNIKGLDFTHTGLVYQDERGNIGLIHASPAGQVVIASDLQDYVQNVRNAIGIVVARPHLN